MPLKDLLFGFKGRIRRRDWWLWGIGVAVAWMAASTVVGRLLFGSAWAEAQFSGAPVIGSWSMTAFGLAAFVPLLWVHMALAAKRAHDRNRGALIAVSLTVLAGFGTFVPEVVDLVTASSLTDSQFNTLATAANLGNRAANLYLIVVLGFLDGTPGPNRFGRSPKGVGGDMPDQTAQVFS